MPVPPVFVHLFAQAGPERPIPWHADSFGMAVVATVVFGAIGIALAILGFKIFDMVTPGNLQKEILEKQNIAAAIIAGAIIVGVCIITAAAIL
jgi:uncharacterized membrane protein YjfL (UPF0719 family)